MAKKKPNIRAVFFDLGGVIVTGPPTNTVAYLSKIFAEWKLPDRSRFIKKYIRKLGRGEYAVSEVADKIAKLFYLSAARRREIRHIFSAKWYVKNMHIDQNVLNFARRLGRRYRIGIISDTFSTHTKINAQRGIFRGFKPVILSHRIHAYKPERRIFSYALTAAKSKAYESVFIDDRQEKLIGAIRSNMHGILFKNLQQLKRDLKKLGVAWN